MIDLSNHILSFLCVFINRPFLFLTFSTGSLPNKHVNQTNGSEKHSIRHVTFLTCGATVAPFTDSSSPPSPLNLPLTCLSCHSHSQRLSVSRSLSTVSTRPVLVDQSLSAASLAFQVSGRVFAFNLFLSRLENPSGRNL